VILEEEMAETSDDADRDALVAEYGRLQERFISGGGYSIEADAKRILGGLGFSNEDMARRTETFSGGWLMRIALAKLLVANPDLLMLDEPTNHLDLESVVWLEKFLRSYEGAVLLISHDRDLINALSSKVVELREAKLYQYVGDYEAFVTQREAEIALAEAAARNQARKIAQTELFINRFRYKASLATRVQSRIKALDKVERIKVPTSKRKDIKIRFPEPPRPGRIVMSFADVSFAYGDKPVYEGLTLDFERGEKIALVGPNGAGKSTLMKLTAGVLEPAKGERKIGHKANVGYFAQHQIEALNLKNTVLQELASAIPPGTQLDARRLLGSFLFTGDDAEKRVGVLSGGERTRLALAKLLVAPFNVLCLDEPTNHLDMWSRDALEEALHDYPGTIVLITHDRHLIRSVAGRIVEVVDGRVTDHMGDYDYYLGKKAQEEPQELQVAEASSVSERVAGPKTKDQKRAEAEARAATKSLRDRISRIETELASVGAELATLEETFAAPDIYSSGADIVDITTRYEAAKKKVAKLEAQWAEAVESLEQAT
jgi:ATP-binding cassette subfamily F protein 3